MGDGAQMAARLRRRGWSSRPPGYSSLPTRNSAELSARSVRAWRRAFLYRGSSGAWSWLLPPPLRWPGR
eukprot:9104087-Alexandrium_andersonii.AAC.1